MRSQRLAIFLFIFFYSLQVVRAIVDVSIDDLLKIEMPLIVIQTVNNELPTFDEIDNPPGCWGVGITNVTKVPGRLRILLKNDTLYDSGDYIEKESGMTIRVRGNTSAVNSQNSQLPYKIKLQKKADLLCRGDKSYNDKNWLLLRKEKLLWTVGFTMNRLFQLQWTPSHEYVNVILNDEYIGVYVLAEAVNRNTKGRLNVDETGFVFEYDAYWWNEDVYVESSTRSPMNYTFKYPDTDDITEEQLSYFTQMINALEQSVDVGTYPDYIDVNSFASWILAQDILGNKDGGGSNVFLTKYDNTGYSKVIMANLWDFDRLLQARDEWSWCRLVFLWPKLFSNQNRTFTDTYVSKWDQTKDWIFDDLISYMEDFKNSSKGHALDESLAIEKTLLNGLNEPYGTVEDYVENVRNWLQTRKIWMEDNINQMRTSSVPYYIQDNSIITNSYYNLGGARFSHCIPFRPGIYIHNKRKVFVK